jgi:predicted transcriptional regulator
MQGQLTIRLNSRLEQGLEALSHRFHQKRSEIVRLALERFITEEATVEEPSTWQKVQHLAGSVETGISDLGEAHQDHLRVRFKHNVY